MRSRLLRTTIVAARDEPALERAPVPVLGLFRLATSQPARLNPGWPFLSFGRVNVILRRLERHCTGARPVITESGSGFAGSTESLPPCNDNTWSGFRTRSGRCVTKMIVV